MHQRPPPRLLLQGYNFDDLQQLAIRLGYQKSIAKSLVIPQAGEEANEKYNR
jgi:hypothetical protein